MDENNVDRFENLEIFKRVHSYLEERRERVLSGKINCIPWGLPTFELDVPGIERGKYYCITGNQKSGKSQLANYLFLYNPIKYAIENPGKLKLKIFYFTLEMSVEQIYQQYMSFLLYTLSGGKIRISPKDLRSTSMDKPLSPEILEILKGEEYIKHMEYLETHVEFIDSISNPFGIFKMMRDYANNNGIQYRKIIEIKDNEGNIKEKVEVDDYYEPYNPEEYVMCIVDHVSLINPEKNSDLRNSIIKLSSDYFVKIRNKYGYIPVLIQQQAAAQEGVENLRAGKLRPSADGLADAKVTSRDFDYLFGIFSPFRHEIPLYKGYDITKLKDHIRFMEVVLGREGNGGSLYPLYFDGAVNFFKELPKPEEVNELNMIYKFISELK